MKRIVKLKDIQAYKERYFDCPNCCELVTDHGGDILPNTCECGCTFIIK